MRRWLIALALAPAAALASHPLITEDTGVLGAGVRQVEVHGERAREGGRRQSDTSGVLAYGIAERADLQLEVQEGGEPSILSAKWRFLEREALALVAKPDLWEDGRWGVNFVAGYELGRVELLAHTGYLRNRNDVGERRSLTHASAAAVFSATHRLKLIVDLARDTNPDPDSRTPIREVVYGLVFSPGERVDLGLGLKRGLTDPAEDRALVAGIKLRF